MAQTDSSALITRYVTEVLGQGRFDLLDEICAPDYRRYLAPGAPPLDLAAQRARLEGFRATVAGTHEGALLNLPATGNEVATSALDMIRIRDGRFTDHWGGPDLFTLLQGCGGTLVPKG